MELRYYSQWVFYIFVLWGIGYLGNISLITRYIHPYHITLFASIGFTGLLWYWTFVTNHRFELSYLLSLALIHYLPLYLSYTYAPKTYSLYLLLLTLPLYFLYMSHIERDPVHIYLVDTQPTKWEEIWTACQGENPVSPLCVFLPWVS